MSDMAHPHARSVRLADWRNLWVRVAAALCLAAPALFLIAAFGTKFGVFSWAFGFTVLTLQVLPLAALTALAAGLAALALAFLVKPMRFRRAMSFFLLGPVLVLGLCAQLAANAARAPPIHDVSTDLENPPGFSPLVAAERALIPGGNGLDLLNARMPAGMRVTEVQRLAYPDIQPITSGAAPSRALAAARGAAAALGWTIDRVDEEAGVIEARDIEFWYGQAADVVVRVTPANPGAVIDVRSVSRVGESDLGANAARVRAFAQAIARELSR